MSDDKYLSTINDSNIPIHQNQKDERRLRDIDFIDLFISERGESFFRGSEETRGPLSVVPHDVIYDIDNLHRIICDTGQTRAEFFVDYDGMRFRVSRIEDVDGVWYVLRRAPWSIPRLGQLGGVPSKVIEALGLIGRPGTHGLILIAGATAQGKTTTAYSLLQEYLLWYGDVAVTLEDPVEQRLSGACGQYGRCFQIEVPNGDFADAMKKTMRRSPRYIFLGEVRSSHEASQALRAAINGHLVITTIHAGSVVEAINAMLKFISGEESLDLARTIFADGVSAILHQRLIKIKTKNGYKRMLRVEYLFAGVDKGLRSLIRSGKTEQLSTFIDIQTKRVESGNLPI